VVAFLVAWSAGSAAGESPLAAACAQPAAPQVAVDAAGDPVAVWLCLRPAMSVQSSVRPAGAHIWRAPQQIVRVPSGVSVADLALAVGGAGDAVAVWLRSSVARDATHALTSVVQAAVRPAGAEAWSRAQDLSAPSANAVAPQVAVDRSGDAVVVWSSSCENASEVAECAGTIHEAERPAMTGTWSSPKDISAPGHSASAPRVAVDPAGTAVAVWTTDRGFVQAVVRAASTARWSMPQDLGATHVTTEPPEIALDAAGNAIVVYVAGATIESIVRPSATGMWGRPEDLPSVGQSYPEFLQVAVAMNAAGEAVAVWRRGSEDAPPPVVQASVRSLASGRWSVPETLSDASAEAGLPEVALDAAGNAVAVWQDGVRTSPFICPLKHCTFPAPSVEAAVLSGASGIWSAPRRWQDVGQPQVAVAAGGDALSVWVGVRNHGDVVQATDRSAATHAWTAPERVSARAAARCAVPPLVGLTLPKAEAALRRNDCRVGRITYAYSQRVKRGHVLAQRRTPGTALRGGAPVGVVVSRGRRNR
jgi:PASTA domain-containing protein